MRLRTRLFVPGLAAAVVGWCAMGGVASATFPNFSDCPIAELGINPTCLDVQSNEGTFEIKGFRVPLDHSLEIRGGLTEGGAFVPATGTNGFIAQPVRIPGGLLGLELPFSFETVLATAELAGTSSQIRANPQTLELSLPLKVRLSNPLLGRNCHIGTNRNPVRFNLIVGTTEPPPPNRPITGRVGTFEFVPPHTILFRGNLNVENSFSIPGATECGGLFELNNVLVDLKLGLPSAAGNNSISITNDVGIEIP